MSVADNLTTASGATRSGRAQPADLKSEYGKYENSREALAHRIGSNGVKKDLDVLAILSDGVARGVEHAVLSSGPPGVGKTYIVQKALAAASRSYSEDGSRSLPALVDTLYQHRRGIILVDDRDGLISADKVGMLKRALDPRLQNRVISYKIADKKIAADKPHLGGQSFLFEGAIIILMNKDIDNPRHFSPKIAPDLQAIASRVRSHKIRNDPVATWEYSCYLAICEGMFKGEKGVGADLLNAALRYFTETLFDFNDGSPRRLNKIVRTMLDYRGGWQDILNNGLNFAPRMEGAERLPVPQVVPKIRKVCLWPGEKV